MVSHSRPDNTVTPEQVASLQIDLETCPPNLRKAQHNGRERLMEVAVECDHLRVLPANRSNTPNDIKQSTGNVVAILNKEPDAKFSAHIEVAQKLHTWSVERTGN